MDYQAQLTGRIDEIQKKLRECNYECNRMKDEIAAFVAQTQTEAPKTAPPVAPLPETKTIPPIVEPAKQEPVVTDQILPKTPSIEQKVPETVEAPAHKFVPSSQRVPQTPTPVAPVPPVVPAAKVQTPPPPKPPKTRDSKSEFERFIGENILNKIGIAILVIGIAFFIKFSIDRGILGPIGRVLVGILSGGIMLGTAHFLRKNYKAFSSVLLGGGMATLYFTTFASFQFYDLITQPMAFAILIFLTIATVVFSIAYNRQEIAMVALVGGFAAPLLVSTGDGNFKVLFSYLAILNAGMLILSTLRKWRVVNVTSFFLTALFFGSWQFYNVAFNAETNSGWALFFGTLFFVEFFAMNVVYQARTKESFDFLAYMLLIANSGLYFASGITALNFIQGGDFQGLFTALLGAFHLGAIFLLKNLFKADNRLIVMLIGMVITFITLAIPIQLEGNYITMFWAAEAVALFWVSRKAKVEMMFIASLVVSVLAVIGLIWDWQIFYTPRYDYDLGYILDDRNPFFNKAFLTSFFVSAAFAVIHLLDHFSAGSETKNKWVGQIFLYLSIPVLYFSFFLEFIYLGGHTLKNYLLEPVFAAAFTGVFIAGLLAFAKFKGEKVLGMIAMGAGGLLVLVTPLFVQPAIRPLIYLVSETSQTSYFGMHWVLYASLTLMVVTSLWYVARTSGISSGFGQVFTWLFTAAITLVLSMELGNILVGMGMEHSFTQKAALSILWGGIGFLLIYQGLRHKLIQFRLAALALFGLTLAKLFVLDVWTISQVGRIAAFISLGLVLLVISFLYNRLRNIILKGDATDEEEGDDTLPPTDQP